MLSVGQSDCKEFSATDAVLSIVEVVLITVLVVIFTLLYNVVSTLVGGIHVTLGDD